MEIDIVNHKDEIIGQASFEDLYQEKLTHRIVHVLVFDEEGKLALQLRNQEKDFCPSHWSTTVGGYVESGEDFKEAAIRELEEGLGITDDVEFLSKDFYENCPHGGPQKFLGTYQLTYSGLFDENLSEVEKVEFFSLDEVQNMIECGERFHPELLFLLQTHFDIEV